MTYFLAQLANGVSYGLILALVAVGFVMIFSATGVVNFAHGSNALLGAYIVATLEPRIGFATALLVGLACTAALSTFVYLVLVRNLAIADDSNAAILTIGVDVVMLTLLTKLIGDRVLALDAPWGAQAWRLGSASIPVSRVVAAGVAILVFAALWVLFERTRAGVFLRATADDGATASLLGIRVRRTGAAGWAIAGVLAGLAGLFLASFPASGVTPVMAIGTLAAVPAWVLGGFDSVPGAIAGGMLIGICSSMAIGYASHLEFLGQGFADVVPFALMFAVLIFRPQGLFGRREATRV